MAVPARLRCCLSEDVMVDVAETEFTVPSETFTSFPVDELLTVTQKHAVELCTGRDINSDEHHYQQRDSHLICTVWNIRYRLTPPRLCINNLYLCRLPYY